jgi:hypothetical protein
MYLRGFSPAEGFVTSGEGQMDSNGKLGAAHRKRKMDEGASPMHLSSVKI